MKFTGQIRRSGDNHELMLVTRVGEFYLDSTPPYCIPTENILKAANFPQKKSFKVELILNENGLLVFKDETGQKTSEYNAAGYIFNKRSIVKYYGTKNDDIIMLKKLRGSGIIKTKSNAYDLLINGILINAFEYDCV